MGALRRGQDTFDPGEIDRCLEDLSLLIGSGLDKPIIIKLRDDAAHAVITETACVVGRRNEAAAQGVHLRQRADLTGVAEIICVFAPGKRRTGCRLNTDDPIILLAADLLSHEGGDQPAEVGAAAAASDDHVRLDIVFGKRRLRFLTKGRLMKQYLIQNTSQHVTISLSGNRRFYRFGDGAAQASCGSRMLLQDLASYLCLIRR